MVSKISVMKTQKWKNRSEDVQFQLMRNSFSVTTITWNNGDILITQITIFLISKKARAQRSVYCINHDIYDIRVNHMRVTSMLVTDVGDEMCWWQLYDVGDNFGHFGNQNLLSFYISVGHQHSNDFKSSSSRCHRHHCHLTWVIWYEAFWLTL